MIAPEKSLWMDTVDGPGLSVKSCPFVMVYPISVDNQYLFWRCNEALRSMSGVSYT
jgi:hypothetical protein